ncbi:MAG: putative DNA binding domain-containing protein, partial [Desulfobacterales bacterium]|nr:putative DNA binding domain-containing protein [Desulfobacterales bacterium]
MRFKESEILELKRSTSELKEALIAISAILNKHQRGELYFGIKNDGTVVGQMISDKTLRNIAKAIGDHIEPEIFPVIQNVNLRGKECIHVTFHGNEIPYFAYGRAYIRVGTSNRHLSAKEIENVILEKSSGLLRWDNKPCSDASISDISVQKLKLFLKTCGLSYKDKENSLDKLGLIKNGKLLNAAFILFGKKPEKIFPNAKLRCAVFGRTDTAFIIDRQEFTGDLFHLIEKAEAYIMEHIHIGMKLDGLYRVDVPEIDRNAFREAIINAFCHRDYYEYDSVNIAIFKDRVEIRSPGGLFGGLTIEQITKEMISKRRNELIAEMFHRVHFVEKWGRGIRLILSKEPETVFSEVANIFFTTFKRKGLDALSAKDKHIIADDLKSDLKDLKKDLKTRYSLTDNQLEILNAIIKNKNVTQ